METTQMSITKTSKLWFFCPMEYYSTIKTNENMLQHMWTLETLGQVKEAIE